MIYPFTCPMCNNYDEVICSASEYSDNQKCTVCGEKMNRIFGMNNAYVAGSTDYSMALGPNWREKIKKDQVAHISDFKDGIKPPKKEEYKVPNGYLDHIKSTYK